MSIYFGSCVAGNLHTVHSCCVHENQTIWTLALSNPNTSACLPYNRFLALSNIFWTVIPHPHTKVIITVSIFLSFSVVWFSPWNKNVISDIFPLHSPLTKTFCICRETQIRGFGFYNSWCFYNSWSMGLHWSLINTALLSDIDSPRYMKLHYSI